MWTLKASDIAILAGLTAVITFARDFFARRKKARRKAERGPAEIDSIVLENARSAMQLQSSVTETLRRELDIRDEVIRDQAEKGAKKDVALKDAQQRENALLLRIGELNMENEALRRGAAAKEGGA